MNTKSFPRIVILLFFLAIPMLVYGSDSKIPLGVYEYVYEYNTEDLVENYYIVLSIRNNKFEGRYFGKSDDFDEAREGYLPGFFSETMEDLIVKGNRISFMVKPSKFFSNPITPLTNNHPNPIWNISLSFEARKYTGEYKEGKLVILSDGLDKRVYAKIE